MELEWPHLSSEMLHDWSCSSKRSWPEAFPWPGWIVHWSKKYLADLWWISFPITRELKSCCISSPKSSSEWCPQAWEDGTDLSGLISNAFIFHAKMLTSLHNSSESFTSDHGFLHTAKAKLVFSVPSFSTANMQETYDRCILCPGKNELLVVDGASLVDNQFISITLFSVFLFPLSKGEKYEWYICTSGKGAWKVKGSKSSPHLL